MFKVISILALFFAVTNSTKGNTREVSAWLESTRVTNWGTWADEVLCAEGTYVTGFRLKNQADQGIFVDDTAMNAVELICSSPSTVPVHIVSGEGLRGSWGSYFECAPPSRGVGFQLRSESATLDNTAGNNLALYCDDGLRLEGNGHSWGEWRNVLTCPMNTFLCGIKTQIAVAQPTVNDDTACNNVDMACCTE